MRNLFVESIKKYALETSMLSCRLIEGTIENASDVATVPRRKLAFWRAHGDHDKTIVQSRESCDCCARRGQAASNFFRKIVFTRLSAAAPGRARAGISSAPAPASCFLLVITFCGVQPRGLAASGKSLQGSGR